MEGLGAVKILGSYEVGYDTLVGAWVVRRMATFRNLAKFDTKDEAESFADMLATKDKNLSRIQQRQEAEEKGDDLILDALDRVEGVNRHYPAWAMWK